MQIVNNTDERIVLEPGQAIVTDTTTRQYEGRTYRVVAENRFDGPKDADELGHPVDAALTARRAGNDTENTENEN